MVTMAGIAAMAGVIKTGRLKAGRTWWEALLARGKVMRLGVSRRRGVEVAAGEVRRGLNGDHACYGGSRKTTRIFSTGGLPGEEGASKVEVVSLR